MTSRPSLAGAIVLALATIPALAVEPPAPERDGSPTAALQVAMVLPLPSPACVEGVRIARIARQQGDLDGARRQLDTTLELADCAIPALAEVEVLLRSGGYPAERRAELTGRLQKAVSDPASPLPQGLVAYLVGLRGEASDDQALLDALTTRLQRLDAAAAPAAAPGSPAVAKPSPAEVRELLVGIADLQQRLGRHAEAQRSLQRVVDLGNAGDEILWRALFADIVVREWEAAAKLLARMVEAPDAPAHLRGMYVITLARLGRHEEMVAQLARMTPSGPPQRLADGQPLLDSYNEMLLEAAWALRDAGRDAEAEYMFRRVLARDPEQQEAKLAVVLLYGSAQDRAALQEASAARQQAETDPVRLFEEGSDLLGAGQTENARALLARAAPELAGTDYAEAAWYNLGSAAFKLSRWEEAASALAQAIAVNPGRAESHWKRGIALYNLERWSDAMAPLQRTLELQPDKREVHTYLAACHERLGDATAAARERALAKKP